VISATLPSSNPMKLSPAYSHPLSLTTVMAVLVMAMTMTT
jgi:hypothetical protein